MRLIDVDEAIINFGFEWDDIPPTRGEFVRFLKKQPTVDAVPIVRCGQCKFDNLCCRNVGKNGRRTKDDFCSYGERKEDS